MNPAFNSWAAFFAMGGLCLLCLAGDSGNGLIAAWPMDTHGMAAQTIISGYSTP